MKNISNLEKSIIEWKNTTVTNGERDMLKSFVHSTVSSSTTLDKFSSWIIGASGAIAALTLSNVDKLTQDIFTLTDVKIILIILTGSILCGLVEKILATTCSTYIEMIDMLERKILASAEKFNAQKEPIEKMAKDNQISINAEIDIIKVIQTYIDFSPFYLKWYIEKETNKSIQDPTYADKKIIRLYYRQYLWLSIQSLSFIGFIIYATIKL